MNHKAYNKIVNKIGLGLMQLAFGNTKSAIKCLESALRVLKHPLTYSK